MWGQICTALAQGTTGSAISYAQGGSIESGFLAGFAGGLAGGAFNSLPGKVFAGAIVGGCASMVGGGKFENGAVTGAFAILATEALIKASNYYKDQVGRRADPRWGKNRLNGESQYDSTGRQYPDSSREGIIGLRKPHTPGTSWYSPRNFFKEGGLLSRTLNLVPGMNAVAGLHDYWLNPVTSPVEFNFFNNVGTMVPAAAVSTAAIFGNAMQGSTFSMRLQATSQAIQVNAILRERDER